MSLDLTQSAESVLVQQINIDNPGDALTVEQVSFGSVMANTGPSAISPNQYEAVVLVTAVQGQGLNGSFPYPYNRIDLSTIFTDSNSSFNVDSCSTYAELITAINTAIGTNFQLTVLPDNDTNQLYVAGDITPAQLPIPPVGKTSVQFILTADPNSLIYRNSVILTATTSANSLSTKFSNPSSGLTYTAPAS
jgi:hypothetical protein